MTDIVRILLWMTFAFSVPAHVQSEYRDDCALMIGYKMGWMRVMELETNMCNEVCTVVCDSRHHSTCLKCDVCRKKLVETSTHLSNAQKLTHNACSQRMPDSAGADLSLFSFSLLRCGFILSIIMLMIALVSHVYEPQIPGEA